MQISGIQREHCYRVSKVAADSIALMLSSSIEEGQQHYKKTKTVTFARQEDDAFLSSALANVKIIIADDSKLQRLILQKKLMKIGFKNIDFAENSDELVRMGTQKPYHAIITDLRMPNESDGQKAARKILEHYKGQVQDSPVIIGLSGDNSKEIAENCRDVGMYGFLEKNSDTNCIKRLLINGLYEKAKVKEREIREEHATDRHEQKEGEAKLDHERVVSSACIIA